MRVKSIYCIFLGTFICSFFSIHQAEAQGGTVPTGDILYSKKPSISSPNAAALEKYVEFPLANYTGVPNISMPVHQIELKGLTVPIALSYHASGIKVEDIASDVGIGWSLIAGGNISILSNGLVDEISGYPTSDPANFQKIKTQNFVLGYTGGEVSCFMAGECSQGVFGCDPLDLYTGGDIIFLKNVVRRNADSEPDLYAFNFLGRAGKFFADENGIFRTIPYSDIKIERIVINNQPLGYKITDENGIVYEFKAKEESQENYVNNSLTPINIDYLTTKVSVSYNLSKITTPTGETVDFNYTVNSLAYNLQNTFSRARFSTAEMGATCWQYNSYGNYYYSTSTSNSKTVGANRLQSISASDGKLIKFLYSSNDRTDLPGAKALEKIEVWDYKTGLKLINQFVLAHDYSTNRLTFKSLKESLKPATQFSYNSNTLPDRLSFSQDAYGFYNGKNNTTLLPKDEYQEFWDGADRSIMPALTQAGMLTKITHPTGGSTEYTYEPNEFYVPTSTTTHPYTLGAYLVSSPNQTVTANFTITGNSKKIRMNRTNTWDGTSINNDYCIVHLYGPNNFYQQFVGNSSLNSPPLNLAPGQYTLTIENVGSTYNAEVSLYWFEETTLPPHDEIGGGVRIKEIKKYDRDGNISLLKKFEYKQIGANNSSGISINNSAPIFLNHQSQIININHEGGSPGTSYCLSTPCSYYTQNSNSVSPLTFSNGSHVLYKEVTSYLSDKTQSGYSNYKYNISNTSYNVGIPVFPFPPIVPFDWVDGTLLEQNDYSYKNNQFILSKKVKNFYNYDDFTLVNPTPPFYQTFGAKIALIEPPFFCTQNCPSYPATVSNITFAAQQYKFYSSWHRIDKTEQTIYDENGNNPLMTTLNYFYDNSTRIQQTRIEATNSKGESLKTLVKYPFDYPGTAIYDAMVTKNMIAPTIELLNYKNGSTFLQSTKSNYNFWNNGWGINTTGSIIVPQSVEAKVLTNLPEVRQQINSYDAVGNILEIQKPNDVKEVYLYGYNSNYPVAKVIGSDLTTVRSFISQQILDNLDGQYTDADIRTELNKIRTGLSATDAQVSTYTYKPFIGISSETDPNGRTIYYEYDALNRLILIRDKDNNILKKICYNYTGQPEDCTITCTDYSPNWQNTATALRCQLDETGQNTGYQEQEQKDMNSCSITYNQIRWVQAGINTTACPLPIIVNLTSTNVTGFTGYTASYLNTTTGYTYNFSVPSTTGLQSLGNVPEGNYTLTILRTTGMPMHGTFKSGCWKQTTTGISATFYNVGVTTTTCNSITVDISGQ